ncbi:ArsR family transcriptional regulator [Paenibacillus motobuensis]|uniref:HTH arsR-type domain-containing protein n=1 Tax=Paenibacillus motobuensis TaxID=295324 RepID=A0ABP3HUY2_9BACL
MAYDVKVDVSPIYELLSSFMLYTTRKWINNLDIGREWIHDIQQNLSEEARQAFAEAADYPFSDYDLLYALALERDSSIQILGYLEELSHGNTGSLLARITPYVPGATLEDVERLQTNYAPLLNIWHDNYFQGIEVQYTGMMEEDAMEKKDLLEKMDPEPLIEFASGGLVLDQELPVKHIILVPSIHFRPINTYCFFEEELLIQYPIDIPEADEEEPPICLLRLTQALSKPERLQLLRYLANEPKSMQEMIRDTNESRAQLHHELMILRSAGMLRVHLTDRSTEKFSIRPDGASELQMFLESYIRI